MSSRIALVLLAMALAACSVTKDMDDMKNTTKDMADTTKAMGQDVKETNAKTGGMQTTMTGMADNVKSTLDETRAVSKNVKETGESAKATETQVRKTNTTALETFKTIRQGTVDVRLKAFQALRNAKTMDSKVANAAKYLTGFEFQLYKGEAFDTKAARETMMGLAAGELFRDIKELLAGVSLNPGMPTFQNNNIRTLLALSATLHEVNFSQLELKISNGTEPVSFLSMIKEALSQRKAIDDGKINAANVPDYISEILQNEDVAIYLLQQRYNFLTAAVVSKLFNWDTNPSDESGLLPAETLISAFYRGHFSMKEVNLAEKNPVEIATYNKWMREAINTRTFLADNGIAPVLDGEIDGILKHMKFTQAQDASKNAPNNVRQLYTDFISLMNQAAF